MAAMTRPNACPGSCIYCPNDPTVPRSYTTASPAVLRGLRFDFDAFRQVEARLRMFRVMGHPTDKVELIVMGGTFLASPVDYQYNFIKGCYDALNGTGSASLEEAKHINETAFHRCVGLCLETRPDWCGRREIDRMLEFGVTRVELGVQTLDDSIYELVKRGHGVKQVTEATRLLKDTGMKVHYHWMPGLPGSSPEHDLDLSRRLFESPDFRPDGMKLYPTLVVKGTELERWYHEGRYRPYDMEELASLLVDIKRIVPPYVRISRLMRDMPVQFIVAGCRDLALRDVLKKRMEESGAVCRCIRCREYGHRAKDGLRAGEPSLRRLDYEASGGREVFLSYEDEDETLFGLLRLRIWPRRNGTDPTSAMVRELHIYGPEVPLDGYDDAAAQHKGLGKSLLGEAERIAAGEFGCARMAILSGVGAREYYRSEFGYELEGNYMVREIRNTKLESRNNPEDNVRSSIKVISFDAEGTLVTPDFSAGMWYECIPEYYGKKMGLGFEEARDAVVREYERVGDGRIEWYDVRYWFQRFGLGDYREAFERCKPRAALYPEVREVLGALDGKYRLIIISASAREFLEYLVNGISGHFEAVISTISDYRELKSPDFYRRVCSNLGVQPSEMVHVGDNRQYDFDSPREAGLRAFHLDRKGEHAGAGAVKSLAEFKKAIVPS